MLCEMLFAGADETNGIGGVSSGSFGSYKTNIRLKG